MITMQPRMKHPAMLIPDFMQTLMALGKAVKKGGVSQRTVDLWTSDAHAWDQMNPALPKFEKYPPSEDSAGPGRS